MKKIIVLLVAAVLCLMLCGCSKSGSGTVFVQFYEDPATGVNYVRALSGYGVAICPRYNPDGSLYVGDTEGDE